MKILLELWTGIGPLIRSLPIAKELQKRGHEIQFLSHDQSAEIMLASGFEQAALNPKDIAMPGMSGPDWRSIDSVAALRGFADMAWIERSQKVWHGFLRAENFDLIISDFGVQSALAARCMKIPLVTITQSCMHPGRKGGRIWYWEDARDEEASDISLKTTNAFLARFGAEPLKRYDDLYVGDKTLIPGIPEFDWLEEQDAAKTYYIGPVLWGGLHDKEQELQPFKQTSFTIFAYTGRMKDSAGNSGQLILDCLLDAANKRPNLNFLISTGGLDLKAESMQDRLSDNVKIVDWLPISQAFSIADLVIHHGGHGSCMANIIYGKPALVLPTHTERNFNAHRIKDLELGNFIERQDLNAESLLKGIELLLENHHYTDTVKKYQQVVQENYQRGVERAADIIES